MSNCSSSANKPAHVRNQRLPDSQKPPAFALGIAAGLGARPMYRLLSIVLISSATLAAYTLGSRWLDAGCSSASSCPTLDPIAKFFAIIAFIATFIGCAIGFFVNRKRLSRVPSWLLAAACLLVAGILVFVYPYVPSWPFSGIGLVVTWVFVCIALWSIVAFSAGYART